MPSVYAHVVHQVYNSAERLTSIKTIGISKMSILVQCFCISSNCGSWYVIRWEYESVSVYERVCAVRCFVNLGRGQFMHILSLIETIPSIRVNNRTCARARARAHKIIQRMKKNFFSFQKNDIYFQCAENDLFRCLH